MENRLHPGSQGETVIFYLRQREWKKEKSVQSQRQRFTVTVPEPLPEEQ